MGQQCSYMNTNSLSQIVCMRKSVVPELHQLYKTRLPDNAGKINEEELGDLLREADLHVSGACYASCY
jgi:hypothetical protein